VKVVLFLFLPPSEMSCNDILIHHALPTSKTENYQAQINLKSLVAILQMRMANIIQHTRGSNLSTQHQEYFSRLYVAKKKYHHEKRFGQ